MVPEERDWMLLEKISNLIKGGVSESAALQFFSDLSIADYDRLIALFQSTTDALPPTTKEKLCTILMKLREARVGVK